MPATSCPLNRICPDEGAWVPAIRLKNVVLPAPLGPMIALIWPASKRTDTSLTAVSPPNFLVRLRTSSMVGSRARGGDRRRLHRARGLLLPATQRGGAARLLLEEGADNAIREENDQQYQ